MRRRSLLQALVIPMLSEGCAAPGGAPPRAVQPTAGTLQVGAAYPPIGARWQVRVTETGLFHRSVDDRDITATPVDFEGRRGYGLASVTATRVLDPATFNPIGTLRDGKVVVVDTPAKSLFSWPLWVGKSWDAANAHADRSYGESWPPSKSQTRVAGIETVTVPAGTFEAFRIEYHGGMDSAFQGGRKNPGRPGFESSGTYWYAPVPKLIVKSDSLRLAENYRWAGRTTSELLSTPR